MIHLQCQGFLFNNVTQYAVARILAEEMGYRLKISHSHNKPKVNTPQFIQLMASFKDAPLDIPGQEFHHHRDGSYCYFLRLVVDCFTRGSEIDLQAM